MKLSTGFIVALAMGIGITGGCTLILGSVDPTDTALGSGGAGAGSMSSVTTEVGSGGTKVASASVSASASSASASQSSAGTGGMGGSGSGSGGASSSVGGSSSSGGPTTDADCMKMAGQACYDCEATVHPTGSMIYGELATCIECSACYDACMATTDRCGSGLPKKDPCETVGDSGITDCNTCATCAQAGSCGAESMNCSASPDCVAYDNALNLCQP